MGAETSIRLVGPHEIRVMLGGISRQRVYQLTNHPDFPVPLAHLTLGKVWAADDVETWVKKRRRADAVHLVRDETGIGPTSGVLTGSRRDPNDHRGHPAAVRPPLVSVPHPAWVPDPTGNDREDSTGESSRR